MKLDSLIFSRPTTRFSGWGGGAFKHENKYLLEHNGKDINI